MYVRISGPHASIVAYTSEFYGKKERGRISLIVGFAITSGNIVSAGVVYVTWHHDKTLVYMSDR